MTDITEGPYRKDEEHSRLPTWTKTLVGWLAIPTAILVAFLALTDALDKTTEHLKGWCQTIHVCPAPKRPILQIGKRDSGWIDGGTTNGHAVCESMHQTLQKQYPDYTIRFEVLNKEEERRTVWRGLDPTHAQYLYKCEFWGEPNG
jgi:hypothetical protein